MLLPSNREIARKVRYVCCRRQEPVNYVAQIQNHYDHYVKSVPLQQPSGGQA